VVVLFFLLKHKNIMRTHKTHNFYGKSVVIVIREIIQTVVILL
jgi:hypothetical protein